MAIVPPILRHLLMSSMRVATPGVDGTSDIPTKFGKLAQAIARQVRPPAKLLVARRPRSDHSVKVGLHKGTELFDLFNGQKPPPSLRNNLVDGHIFPSKVLIPVDL